MKELLVQGEVKSKLDFCGCRGADLVVVFHVQRGATLLACDTHGQGTVGVQENRKSIQIGQ
jgi:hypothetical protein